MVAIFFITEIIPLAVTSTAASIACGLLGFIPVKQVFSGLSNSTVVLFAGMFVVGASMFYTGLAQKIGETVVKITGTGENSLMFGIMIVGVAVSAVSSPSLVRLLTSSPPALWARLVTVPSDSLNSLRSVFL